MIQIIPAILATTEAEYFKRIEQIESSGIFKDSWVQIDLMDNKFVQNKSIDPEIISKYPTDLKLEAHLMVADPFSLMNELIKARVKRIIAPVEIHFQEIDRILDMVRDLDIEVGLSLNPETKVSKVESYSNDLDVVLIMSVHPGFQGQEFIPETIEKIKECSRLRSNNKSHFKIEVDGGISQENVRQVVEAGADYVVIGSGLFKYDNLEVGLEKIWEALRG